MNRLGLFKRAAALVVAPTLPMPLRAVGMPEPPLPAVGFTTGYASFQGQPYPYAMPLHSHGAHTHDLSAHAHTHTHCLCYGNCRGCCH